VKKIICDLCKSEVKEEKNLWYVQFPAIQKENVYANGKKVGNFGSYLGYKILEICPNCAYEVANSLKPIAKEIGIEI